jgi:hypothetical protein
MFSLRAFAGPIVLTSTASIDWDTFRVVATEGVSILWLTQTTKMRVFVDSDCESVVVDNWGRESLMATMGSSFSEGLATANDLTLRSVFNLDPFISGIYAGGLISRGGTFSVVGNGYITFEAQYQLSHSFANDPESPLNLRGGTMYSRAGVDFAGRPGGTNNIQLSVRPGEYGFNPFVVTDSGVLTVTSSFREGQIETVDIWSDIVTDTPEPSSLPLVGFGVAAVICSAKLHIRNAQIENRSA